MAEGRDKNQKGLKGSDSAGGGDLRFTVWQFVRLMDQAEKSRESGPNAEISALFKAFGAAWDELDARLEALGRENPEAFADLMMDQEIILEDVTPGLRTTVEAELCKVIHSMKQTLNRGAVEAVSAEDLQFEIAELEAIAQNLIRP